MTLFFAFISCGEKESKVSERKDSAVVETNNPGFYPNADRFDPAFELSEVNLDTVVSYSQLYNHLEEIACEGKNPVIQFNLKEKVYNVAVNVECPEMSITDCYFFVHHLYLNKNSVIYDLDQKKDLKKLPEILTGISSNFSKDDFEAERTAVVWIYLEGEQPIDEVKEILVNLMEDFETINQVTNNDFPYFIYLENQPYTPGLNSTVKTQ